MDRFLARRFQWYNRFVMSVKRVSFSNSVFGVPFQTLFVTGCPRSIAGGGTRGRSLIVFPLFVFLRVTRIIILILRKPLFRVMKRLIRRVMVFMLNLVLFVKRFSWQKLLISQRVNRVVLVMILLRRNRSTRKFPLSRRELLKLMILFIGILFLGLSVLVKNSMVLMMKNRGFILCRFRRRTVRPFR